MKRLIGILTVLFFAGCGGMDVRGIVRDESTGEPLPGATVRIGERSTTTDLTGYYNLEVDGRDDPQQIHVQKAGYEAFSEQVTFDRDADEIYHDIELRSAEERRQQQQQMNGQQQQREGDLQRDQQQLQREQEQLQREQEELLREQQRLQEQNGLQQQQR
ncbi:MAG: carboxypeptidase-like regulatory domain-containing protein [Planctomycetes bacterium]|nr:carboxypeptidase-like regulatory domain-containing protein [Planctomycetota bacterium]